MIRTSVSLVIVLVVLAGCTKKDDQAAQAAGAAATGAAAPAVAAKAAGGKAVNWEKIERIPFARMQGLLPDTVLGLKRSDLRGSTNPDGERTYSEASADYTGPNETHLTLTIQDHPVQAVENIGSKTTSFKGYPVFREHEGSDDAQFHFVVGDRFIVEAHGSKLKVAQLKTAFDKIDLAKLATWKLEGVK
jgi:hypothetical protein